jgi:peptidoglycan/xylan/chitin deacetylase (PgdA/CDA1 family)
MYHSVPPPETERYVDVAWRMSPARFEEQVRFLARHRRVIALGELVRRLREGREPDPGSVVLTFDDGYRDNLEVAAPILRKHGLPATLFLATGYVNRGETQWVDRLYVIFTSRRKQHCEPVTGPSPALRYDLRDPHQCRAAHAAVAGQLLEASHAEREQILSRLETELDPCEKPPRLTLDWSEVRELAVRYPELELGVHTADHIDLAHSAPDTIRSQLETCLADVERELGRRPRHFSFPYGRSSPLACRLATEAGLDCAMGPSGRWLVDASSDLYSLPRLDALMSATQLRLRTHPAYAALPSPLTSRG